ncbi:MAG: damage-inducible protein CinA [Treponema sp.]|nr:MAG: damage-inducible protein CinA [Treponema sp.]
MRKADIVGIAFDRLKDNSLTLITAESLTAGLIASCFADIPGASEVLWGGYIVYTPEAKFVELGVGDLLIAKYGIVSEEVAKAMAYGALCKSGIVDNVIALSITGYAGPTGGTVTKPIGTVCVGIAHSPFQATVATEAKTFRLVGGRNEKRERAVQVSMEMLIEYVDNLVLTKIK